MNAPALPRAEAAALGHSPTPLERLRRIAEGALRPQVVCVRARRMHGAHSVDVAQHQIGIVLHGDKSVRCGVQALRCCAGDLLAMTAGARIDATNTPDAASGRYLSLLLPICPQVQQAARVLWPHAIGPCAPQLAHVAAASIDGRLAELATALEQEDEALARVACLGLTMDAMRAGCTGLVLPPAPTVAAQVRAHVAAAPGRAWCSADLEATLAMSGATLRRRLADEGTNLRAQIAEARLAAALDLLYTTRLPIKTVAARVGYRSVDSFSRRFRDRYGMPATAIGNAAAAPAQARSGR